MKIKVISLLILFCFILALVSCNKYGIDETKAELVFPTTVNKEISMNVGDTLVNSYIMYKGLVNFAANDILFVSSNPDVAIVEISTQEFPIYTYFDIKALSVGETLLHAETADGTVQSEAIKVIVHDSTEIETYNETVTKEIFDTIPETEPLATETELKSEIFTETVTDAKEVSEPQTESKPVVVTPSVTEIQTEPLTEKVTSAPEIITSTYVLNKSSKKIHLSGCTFVNRMKEENKEFYSGSLDSLISSGYSVCKTCKP